MPDEKESIKFWSRLWDNPADHNRNAEWIMTAEKELESGTRQGNINIAKEDVSIHLPKMPNWKVPGPDGLNGFWLKKFTSFHLVMVKNRECSQLDGGKSGQSLYRKM